MRRFARSFIVLAVLTVFVSDAGCDQSSSSNTARKDASKESLYEEVELLADTISAVRSDYVEDVDSKKLIYGAMRGMLSGLDDYSQFMDPDEFKEIQVETKGEFGGLGIEISLKDGVLTIITPLVGTPAEAAGIKPGDKIVKIDGKITKDITLNEAVKLMRGKPGTAITLTIWREEAQKVFDLSLKRAIIKVRSIKKAELIADKIGYIRLIEFQENTARDLDAALKKLESQGMDSLILDVRNNPGGLLDAAIDVAQRFLGKDKEIVSIKARDPSHNAVFKSSGRFTRPGYPLVVLVNGGSASGSEIVAGAIKDNRRGIVLGAKTFGKASVQTVLPLRDGSALRITTALYLTPDGKLIKDEGIVPDVIVEKEIIEKKAHQPDIFDRLEEEKTAEAGKPKPQPGEREKEFSEDMTSPGTDNQLQAAVNLMKALKVYRQEEKR